MREQTTISKIHKWMLFFTDPGAKSILFVLNNGGKNGIEALDKLGDFTLILFYLLFSVGNPDMSHLSQSRGGTSKSYFLVPRGTSDRPTPIQIVSPEGGPGARCPFWGVTWKWLLSRAFVPGPGGSFCIWSCRMKYPPEEQNPQTKVRVSDLGSLTICGEIF